MAQALKETLGSWLGYLTGRTPTAAHTPASNSEFNATHASHANSEHHDARLDAAKLQQDDQPLQQNDPVNMDEPKQPAFDSESMPHQAQATHINGAESSKAGGSSATSTLSNNASANLVVSSTSGIAQPKLQLSGRDSSGPATAAPNKSHPKITGEKKIVTPRKTNVAGTLSHPTTSSTTVAKKQKAIAKQPLNTAIGTEIVKVREDIVNESHISPARSSKLMAEKITGPGVEKRKRETKEDVDSPAAKKHKQVLTNVSKEPAFTLKVSDDFGDTETISVKSTTSLHEAAWKTEMYGLPVVDATLVCANSTHDHAQANLLTHMLNDEPYVSKDHALTLGQLGINHSCVAHLSLQYDIFGGMVGSDVSC